MDGNDINILLSAIPPPPLPPPISVEEYASKIIDFQCRPKQRNTEEAGEHGLIIYVK